MNDNSSNFATIPIAAFQFLCRFPPFNELDVTVTEELARRLEVEFYPKGTTIFRQGLTDITHFYVIQKGSVQVFLRSENDTFTLRNVGGEGETLGGPCLIRDQKPDVTVETLEDTFCFLIPKALFLKIVSENVSFEKFFLAEFQKERISAAYLETRNERIRSLGLKRLDYFTSRVSDVIRPNFQVVRSDSSIQQTGQILAKFRIGSLLVTDGSSNIVGIVTKKDLRSKVVAGGMDYRLPVSTIMSAPVKTIPVQARLFETTLLMIKEQISHLAAVGGSDILGIITTHDIMVHQAASPIILFREIQAQKSPESMNSLFKKIPTVINNLMEEGAKASHCINMITLFHDRIFIRALKLFGDHISGADLSALAPILVGKAARMEQTFVPVYDYIAVYGDESNSTVPPEAYLEKLATQLNDFFENCFGKNLRSKISAANPRWRGPLEIWSKYIDEWTSNPIPPEIRIAKNFLDARSLPGANNIADSFLKLIFKKISSSENFMKGLADDFLSIKPPVSFFRDIIVEADGTQINKLDMETRVAEPFADFARLLCLRHRISETNTLVRLKSLARMNVINKDLCSEVLEAHEFQTQLVLISQLRALDVGATPGYIIDPIDLSDLEKRTLKDTFGVLGRLQAIVAKAFL
jgi:CBS domain-containing protein